MKFNSVSLLASFLALSAVVFGGCAGDTNPQPSTIGNNPRPGAVQPHAQGFGPSSNIGPGGVCTNPIPLEDASLLRSTGPQHWVDGNGTSFKIVATKIHGQNLLTNASVYGESRLDRSRDAFEAQVFPQTICSSAGIVPNKNFTAELPMLPDSIDTRDGVGITRWFRYQAFQVTANGAFFSDDLKAQLDFVLDDDGLSKMDANKDDYMRPLKSKRHIWPCQRWTESYRTYRLSADTYEIRIRASRPLCNSEIEGVPPTAFSNNLPNYNTPYGANSPYGQGAYNMPNGMPQPVGPSGLYSQPNYNNMPAPQPGFAPGSALNNVGYVPQQIQTKIVIHASIIYQRF